MLISFQDTLQDSLQPEEYRILAFRLDSQTVCGFQQLFNVLWVFCLFIYFLCVKKFVRLDLFFFDPFKMAIHFECLLSNKWYIKYPRKSVQSLSRVRLFVTPMDCSTPGFPVCHQLLELIQTHVRQVNNGIHPSHPLAPPFPPAFNLSQHQGLFQ